MLFESPKSFRVRELSRLALTALDRRDLLSQTTPDAQYPIWQAIANGTMDAMADHSSHPNFLNLAGLVSEAVLEVVFVALPGYLVAISGMFSAENQKFVAELNTMVFTPCLIFSKLAGQLNAEKLSDLVVIPFIFALQTLVSWLCAQVMSRAFGFGGKDKKMQKNFILAMGVFGNSNSLPISLVLSLSKTISGLHWDEVPGDNDSEVAARGILYLMIFQQLGQLLRWTWGYNVLLKPASEYEDDERREGAEENRGIEEGQYRDEPDLLHPKPVSGTDSGFSSGQHSPDSNSRSREDLREIVPAAPDNGNNIATEPRNLVGGQNRRDSTASAGQITAFPSFSRSVSHKSTSADSTTSRWKQPLYRVRNSALVYARRTSDTISTFFHNIYRRLPAPIQRALSTFQHYNGKFWAGVWRQMNPPLWAMLAALIVASIPQLQAAFFTKGTLINNSVTRAIQQSGGVAVPLILAVLGANLARGTIPKEQLASNKEQKREEWRLLWASLLSRMFLPVIIMAPLIALTAKFVPVSILDDPIFIIVCFLLTGAPSALQLAQICQINNVFMGAMSSLLVFSYVVFIFPSTLLLVLAALETLEWALVGR